MCWNQQHLDTLLLGSIPIIHEQAKDSNNKNKDLKARIYYLDLKIMLKLM